MVLLLQYLSMSFFHWFAINQFQVGLTEFLVFLLSVEKVPLHRVQKKELGKCSYCVIHMDDGWFWIHETNMSRIGFNLLTLCTSMINGCGGQWNLQLKISEIRCYKMPRASIISHLESWLYFSPLKYFKPFLIA